MVWNAVAAIGGTLLSGLFGSKKKKEESTSVSTVDLGALTKDAIRWGYNPLTIVRSGGMGGYVTTKTKGSSSGGGPSVGAAIGDAIASAGANNLFGSFNTPKNDPIKVKSKSTGAVSTLVSSQLRGGVRVSPTVNVRPTQRVIRSPTTTYVQAETLNKTRMHNGTFVGPRMPKGSGPNGEIEDAMVAYRRSDGSLMWTYNPNMIDGDAAVAAAATDAANRGNDEWNDNVRYPSRNRMFFVRPNVPAQAGKVGRYAR